MLKIIHHWWLPLISGLAWWSMLITLLVLWSKDGFKNYSVDKKPHQTFMYISDVSATTYKPIFITGSAVQGLLFTLSIASEFYLRRIGRLRQHCQLWANWALGTSFLFAIIGQLGILFVAIFDLNSYPNAHISMLVVFIVFVGISALLNVASFAALDMTYMNARRVKLGLWLKVCWFLVEFVLAIVFVGLQLWFINIPALLEWIISFVYPFYHLIMVYDLWPANDKMKGHYPRYNMAYPDKAAAPTGSPWKARFGADLESRFAPPFASECQDEKVNDFVLESDDEKVWGDIDCDRSFGDVDVYSFLAVDES